MENRLTGQHTSLAIGSPMPPPHWALLERELLRAQEAACAEYARKEGWIVLEEVLRDTASGFTLERRIIPTSTNRNSLEHRLHRAEVAHNPIPLEKVHCTVDADESLVKEAEKNDHCSESE